MATKHFDIETFRDKIIEIIQNNLDSKINDINIEKRDNHRLTTIPKGNYYNDITDQVLNKMPFIYYGFFALEAVTVGDRTAATVTMFVSVVFDNKNKDEAERKALRYARVLKDVVNANNKYLASASGLEVVEFLPEDFEDNKGSDFKVGGIHIKATIV